MSLDATIEKKKGVPTRYLILLIIFIVTAVNYADRATFPNAGTEVAKELPLSAVSMSYIFSCFRLGLPADAALRRLAAR